MGDDALARRIAEAVHVECPVHGMRDCSPLLNGCSWPSTLKTQEERAVEAAREHYGPILAALQSDDGFNLTLTYDCGHRQRLNWQPYGLSPMYKVGDYGCPFDGDRERCRVSAVDPDWRAVRDERG